MPTGPKGEKRPADAIGNAVMVAKIAPLARSAKPNQMRIMVRTRRRFRSVVKGEGARGRFIPKTPKRNREKSS
jgi:hypothetical protein